MATPFIEIKNLSKRFGDHEVLKDISLSIEQGEVVSIIGSSGSGKSTILRCINLLEEQLVEISSSKAKVQFTN